MNNIIYAAILGAGVGAFVYSTIGRRTGYGNSQNVWTLVGAAFLLSTIIAYTIFAFVISK